jgi:hypothetical protein
MTTSQDDITAAGSSSLRPVVRAAQASDADEVCRFLAQNMGRGLSPAVYSGLFTYPWLSAPPNRGFVLLGDGKVVGYYGAVYAERSVAGVRTRFCNLTNWCVVPEYRRFSMHLLFPLLKASDTVFTNLSPTPEVQPFFERLGFSVLDSDKWFSFPLAHALTLLRFARARIVRAPACIAARLSDEDLTIFRDHQGIGCGHLLLEDGNASCYVVSKKRKRKGLVFSEVLYASSREMLRKHFERIKLSVLSADRTPLLACDERLYGGRPAFGLRYRRVTLVKNASLPREQIDNLYSEIALL